MNEKWFALTVEDIEKKLRTNAASGLSPKAARSRCNRKEAPFFTIKKKRWDKLLLDIFKDFFLVMLVLVAIFSLFFGEGELFIGSAMLVLIVINVVLCYLSNYRSRRSVEAMTNFFSPTARVIRGGKLYIADYRSVVVGDVIMVEKGDVLGCDARLVYSNDLSVVMRLDRKNEKLLKKYASVAINENELYAENMENMLHAGSVIETGSGRAIVVATGKYTYLGAMTGGLTEIPSQELPDAISAIKKTASKIGLLLLLAVIPFCISSILFGRFSGGTVLLSEVLSVALALSAACSLSKLPDVFLGFFTKHIRAAALSDNPCIIRSVKTFDQISDIDYLFMLDGSITTDGILHFESITTADGEANGFDRMGQSAVLLCDIIALYNISRKNSLSLGLELDGAYDAGLSEFMERSAIDAEALKIRCKIQSCLPCSEGGRDSLVYVDRGNRVEANISSSDEVIDLCDSVLFAGAKKPLTEDGIISLKRTYNTWIEAGRKLLVVTVKNGEKHCFVGMLVLREGVDLSVENAVSNLKKSGVKVIVFSNCIGRSGAPEIPDVLRRGKCANAGEFLKKGLPISADFGEFDEYCYLDENMIAELAKHVKSQNKTLAILGFTDYAKDAIDCADIFFTCSPVRAGIQGRFIEEIRALEIPGEQSSASCTQKVKAEADAIFMRPKDKKGGLEPLARIMEYCKAAYRNLKNFLTYLMCVQIMRTITVALPMAFGNKTADARHILFFSCILDFLTMLVFMYDTRRSTQSTKKIKKDLAERNLIKIIRSNLGIFIPVLVGSSLTLLLPNFMNLFDFFGNYSYKAEFTYMALALMQIVTLFCVYSGDLRNLQGHRRLVSSYAAIAQGIIILVFTALCLIFEPIGNFFEITKNPIWYFLASFVPAISLGVCHLVMSVVRNEKKAKPKKK